MPRHLGPVPIVYRLSVIPSPLPKAATILPHLKVSGPRRKKMLSAPTPRTGRLKIASRTANFSAKLLPMRSRSLTISSCRVWLPLIPLLAVLLALAGVPASSVRAQQQQMAAAVQTAEAANDIRAASREVRGVPDTIEPTWNTRPDDRTVYFDIPAPRGQITDRNGLPLATTST